jgi:hypothetical protein
MDRHGFKESRLIMASKILTCFAEGKGDHWEAMCLDCDIAVQGRSFDEAHQKLHAAVIDYIEYVRTLPEDERRRFFNRSAPARHWLRYAWAAFWLALRHNRGDSNGRREFTLACPA